MIKLLLSIFVIVASIPAFGQSEPRKFDEFVTTQGVHYYPYERIDVEQRAKRLEKYLKGRKNLTVFVVAYKARKSTYQSRNQLDNAARSIRSTIVFETGIGDKNTFLLDGGYKDFETIELWIGPKNSKLPPLTPKYDDEYKFECADISIGEKDMNFDVNKPATFSAWIYPKQDVSFQWTPSVGAVVEGQGTESVSIDTKGASKVTLFVEVKGLPETCERVIFKTFNIGKRPFLADETDRYLYSELSARVDAFMIMVNANPQLTGYIIAYAGRNKNDRVEQDRALASVRRIFAFRRYGTDRVKLINGGFREYNSAELWLVPPGVEPPKPTPTVDSKFIKILRTKVQFDY